MVRHKLKIMVSASGRATWAHFRMVYLIPLGPGANVFDVVRRTSVISSCIMLGHSLVSRGGDPRVGLCLLDG
jgi:hypothetical protein